MSAVSSIHERHAAAKQRLTVVRDEAAACLSAHEHATKVKASQLAEIEAAYVANATSEALGLEREQNLPDATVLEKLRADATVAEPVRRQLAANLERCEEALKAGESKHKAAVGDHLRETAVAPAVDEFRAAFDGLRDAAVNLMAAHNLAYHDFSDKRPPYYSANDVSGPAAQWLAALQNMNWPDYPYAIRPRWLPQHGRFWPDELPGLAERMAQLLAEVEQVQA